MTKENKTNKKKDSPEKQAPQKSGSVSQTPQKAKRRNYKKELEHAVAEKNELNDKLLRVAAEFDNYRKRVANERLEWMQQAQATLIESVLPVLDDLERIESANDEQKDYETLHAGILLILKNFRKILSDHGLVEMKTVDEPFDPEKHEALLQIETKDTEPDVVVEQHLKGYEFKDKVIRHAKVIVSK